MSNVVDFAMRMKDMLSGPLRNMAGAFDKVSDEATNAANKVSLFEKMSMGAFGINNIIGTMQTVVGTCVACLRTCVYPQSSEQSRHGCTPLSP